MFGLGALINTGEIIATGIIGSLLGIISGKDIKKPSWLLLGLVSCLLVFLVPWRACLASRMGN